MLGGVVVGEGDGGFVIGGEDDQAVGGEGRGQHLAAIQNRQQLGDLLLDPPGEIRVGGDEHRRRIGPVLCLTQKIGGHQPGVRCVVGQDQGLAGTGWEIDGAGTQHRQLGGGDPGVARAHDLVHRPHGFGAVGEGGNRLGPTHHVHLVDLEEGGGRQERRRQRAVLTGRAGHHDLFDAGDSSRHDGHDQR